jgi:hypothetical protein
MTSRPRGDAAALSAREQPTELGIDTRDGALEHAPEDEKAPSTLRLNLLLSLVLLPGAYIVFTNLDSIVTFIADNVWIMLVLGFFAKLTSKIVFALAFLPIGTLYKLVHALLPVRAGQHSCSPSATDLPPATSLPFPPRSQWC